ncbi:MAG: MBL fold metallo-hydrolase [Candidatus Altiarchaeota archaeon]|nr:MBL fold metallo-hydrolase [Candidatus Altiarchaeota archaeon]
MRIIVGFHGGVQEVGRSCFTIESDGFWLMLDCGLKIRQEDGYPALPDRVDAVVLSHAHLDHSGMLPALHRRNHPKIYATDLSLETSHLLQKDSAKINQLRKERHIYSIHDIEAMHSSEVSIPYGADRSLTENISFKLLDAGHIPGSAAVLLEIEGKKVYYTGDIKTKDTHLQAGAEIPEADVLIIESTYGDRVHPSRREMEKEFLSTIEETVDRGGNALIPAFAVGRTQEVLMMLEDMPYPIYLDGMGQQVTSLFLQYPEYVRDSGLLQKAANIATWIDNSSARKKALSEPSIIVTTAGMVNGGPVFSYLHRLHMDKLSSILLTGYQVEGTNGRLLMEKGYVIDPLTDKELEVRMEKHQFDFSAHAGRHSLEDIAEKVNPEKAFVVHGDPKPCESFAEFLSSICETHTPKMGDTFDL